MSQDIDRLLILERIRSPILPSVLIGGMALVWVLSNAGIMETAPAVLWIAGILIAIALFFGLREFIDERTVGWKAACLIVFAILFAFTAGYTVYDAVFLPAPIAKGDLRTDGGPLEIHPAGISGPYRLVVEGHFPYSDSHANQSVHYHMKLDHDGGTSEALEGDFTERWSMRRLGRRGSAPVRVVRSVNQHEIQGANGEGFRVALDQLSPPTAHDVTVSVHPDSFPTIAMTTLGVVIGAAAIVIDTWRFVDPEEGLLTALTVSALLAAGSFRRFAPPHPGLGDLAFYGVVGGLAGYALGYTVWRIAKRTIPQMGRG